MFCFSIEVSTKLVFLPFCLLQLHFFTVQFQIDKPVNLTVINSHHKTCQLCHFNNNELHPYTLKNENRRNRVSVYTHLHNRHFATFLHTQVKIKMHYSCRIEHHLQLTLFLSVNEIDYKTLQPSNTEVGFHIAKEKYKVCIVFSPPVFERMEKFIARSGFYWTW